MSTRISSAAVTLFLAACGMPRGEQPAGETIACAVDGAAQFAEACTLERAANQLVVHRPDGAFRRLEVVSDGGVAALDGADTARETVLGNGLVEVQVAGERYRFRLEAPGSARP